MRHLRNAASLLLLSSVARPLTAQETWTTPLVKKHEIGLEWVRPSFTNNAGLTGNRGVWILSSRDRTFGRGTLTTAIPYFAGGDGEAFGGLYIGYEMPGRWEGSSTRLEVRLPSTGVSAQTQLISYAGDYDRFEESLRHTLTVRAEAQGRAWTDHAGTTVRVRGGLTALHYTDDTGPSSDDFLFDYGLRLGKAIHQVEFGAAVTGRRWLTDNLATPGPRNIHTGTLEMLWNGPVQLRIGYQRPLGDPAVPMYESSMVFGVAVPFK